MTQPRLTVVVPTRNRSHSLLRLLKSISCQTLSKKEFEVVVVDDGSEPPLDASCVAENLPFLVRLIRRTVQPGAHESRCAGLREARGERVLFLDDDVVLDPAVLAEHAGVQDDFAMGPILYHPDASATPYHRYQTKLYAAYERMVASQGPSVPASDLYICNSSGPTELFAEILESVREIFGGMAIPGDGCDEELMDYQLRKRGGSARFLVKAIALHIDTKTVDQARRERRLHGMMQCSLILKFPELRPTSDSYAILTGGMGLYRTWKIRLFWIAPRTFRLIAKTFTLIADRGPARWVPNWTCYPPMAIAFWDGMYSIAPSFHHLQEALLEGPPRN